MKKKAGKKKSPAKKTISSVKKAASMHKTTPCQQGAAIETTGCGSSRYVPLHR